MNNKPIGTEHSGYASEKDGPFMCCRCAHFDPKDKSCDHPDVLEDAKAGKIPIMKNRPIVDEHACCTYFRPQEKKKGLAIHFMS